MTEISSAPATSGVGHEQGPNDAGGPTPVAQSEQVAADSTVAPAGAPDVPTAVMAESTGGTEASGGSEGADGTANGGDVEDAGDEHHEQLVAEGDAAGDYLERLLDILDYDGDIDLDVEGERAAVSIIGEGDVEKLVGERGEVLGALQELTRLAAGLETGQRSRLMLDIGGYRARRRAELEEVGRATAQKVLASGDPVKLGAMNPFERKVVHDAVATVEGVSSASEGEEPHRRVVVAPTA